MLWFLFFTVLQAGVLEDARDRQDAASLAAQAQKIASKPNAFYELAVVRSYEAEVAMEKGDKKGSASSAEAGIDAARKAVAAQDHNSEYHRILGTLCGQVIPANVLLGLKYGRCAMDEVAKAIELNPKAAENWLARGVGNYYLPPSFGGGIDKSIEDFDKAIQLNAKFADAYMWRGIALRKAGKNAEARKSLAKALELNPKRVWAKTQLDKTPEK
ncbi:tetratricopeptide repeat protein [Bryobacter aggregatus]|uniref:tetratricopeptide repeat protein n=1 Tax=Bryobacter aggregatus TaxID=360054 RepID=UPI0004E282A4|nr:tetratricopeptide repeat protein [Bryobacter aggregatus]